MKFYIESISSCYCSIEACSTESDSTTDNFEHGSESGSTDGYLTHEDSAETYLEDELGSANEDADEFDGIFSEEPTRDDNGANTDQNESEAMNDSKSGPSSDFLPH